MEEDISVQTFVGTGNHVEKLGLCPEVQDAEAAAAAGVGCCRLVAVVLVVQVEIGAAEMQKTA